jgi:hypothetical protein
VERGEKSGGTREKRRGEDNRDRRGEEMAIR